MLNTLKQNNFFFIPYLIFLIAEALLLFFTSKGQIVLWMNEYHSAFLDKLFSQSTHMGEGWFLIITMIILIFIKFRYAIIEFASYLITGLFVQLLKHWFDMPRPKIYLSNFEELYKINDAAILSSYSFPSGHAASIFAIFCLLALISKRKELGLIFLFIALIGAFSRIYLLQHFFIDVYFGSLIGVIITFFIYFYTINLFSESWLDKSIIKFKNSHG